MRKGKKNSQEKHTVKENNSSSNNAGNNEIRYDVSFTKIDSKCLLVAEDKNGIQFFIRRKGEIVSEGYIAEGNELVLFPGDEVAYIPLSGGNIKLVKK